MPELPRLSRSQPLSDFTKAVEKYGCVVITDFTDSETVLQANKEVKPWLDFQGNEGAKVGGKYTIRLPCQFCLKAHLHLP